MIPILWNGSCGCCGRVIEITFETFVISYIVITIQLNWLRVSLLMCHLHFFLFSFYGGEIGLTSQDFYFKLTLLFLVQLSHSLTHLKSILSYFSIFLHFTNNQTQTSMILKHRSLASTFDYGGQSLSYCHLFLFLC